MSERKKDVEYITNRATEVCNMIGEVLEQEEAENVVVLAVLGEMLVRLSIDMNIEIDILMKRMIELSKTIRREDYDEQINSRTTH
jgi:hypothetical protein